MQSCSSKGRCVLLGCEKGGIKLELGKWSCLSGELHRDHNRKAVSSLEVQMCVSGNRGKSSDGNHTNDTGAGEPDLWSSVLSGAWGGAWEETWSLQMLNEEVLRGSRQFLLPEFILAVSVATQAQQSLLGWQGRQCYQHHQGRHFTW